jgi:hypothetical protein
MRAAKVNADDMREHQGVTVPIGFEDALVDVNFNMGADWKTKWPSAYAALLRGDFDRAKLEIRYADPYRSKEFKQELRNNNQQTKAEEDAAYKARIQVLFDAQNEARIQGLIQQHEEAKAAGSFVADTVYGGFSLWKDQVPIRNDAFFNAIATLGSDRCCTACSCSCSLHGLLLLLLLLLLLNGLRLRLRLRLMLMLMLMLMLHSFRLIKTDFYKGKQTLDLWQGHKDRACPQKKNLL